ncbi:unnamed protein product [Amoebophrya sp. A120]|nr:unnamed protein product [Amoebophrya sp. A120]|eukprot:GSA120T00025014001.1
MCVSSSAFFPLFIFSVIFAPTTASSSSNAAITPSYQAAALDLLTNQHANGLAAHLDLSTLANFETAVAACRPNHASNALVQKRADFMLSEVLSLAVSPVCRNPHEEIDALFDELDAACQDRVKESLRVLVAVASASELDELLRPDVGGNGDGRGNYYGEQITVYGAGRSPRTFLRWTRPPSSARSSGRTSSGATAQQQVEQGHLRELPETTTTTPQRIVGQHITSARLSSTPGRVVPTARNTSSAASRQVYDDELAAAAIRLQYPEFSDQDNVLVHHNVRDRALKCLGNHANTIGGYFPYLSQIRQIAAAPRSLDDIRHISPGDVEMSMQALDLLAKLSCRGGNPNAFLAMLHILQNRNVLRKIRTRTHKYLSIAVLQSSFGAPLPASPVSRTSSSSSQAARTDTSSPGASTTRMPFFNLRGNKENRGTGSSAVSSSTSNRHQEEAAARIEAQRTARMEDAKHEVIKYLNWMALAHWAYDSEAAQSGRRFWG